MFKSLVEKDRKNMIDLELVMKKIEESELEKITTKN